jgi:hypothetical protein
MLLMTLSASGSAIIALLLNGLVRPRFLEPVVNGSFPETQGRTIFWEGILLSQNKVPER